VNGGEFTAVRNDAVNVGFAAPEHAVDPDVGRRRPAAASLLSRALARYRGG
jgi:hypothetical protein